MPQQQVTEAEVFEQVKPIIQEVLRDSCAHVPLDMQLDNGSSRGEVIKASIIEDTEDHFDLYIPHEVEDALVTVRDLVQDLTWRLNGNQGQHPILGERGVA